MIEIDRDRGLGGELAGGLFRESPVAVAVAVTKPAMMGLWVRCGPRGALAVRGGSKRFTRCLPRSRSAIKHCMHAWMHVCLRGSNQNVIIRVACAAGLASVRPGALPYPQPGHRPATTYTAEGRSARACRSHEAMNEWRLRVRGPGSLYVFFTLAGCRWLACSSRQLGVQSSTKPFSPPFYFILKKNLSKLFSTRT